MSKAKPMPAPQEADAPEITNTQAVAQNSPGTAVALARTLSPPEMLTLAIRKGSDVEVIERMSQLTERWQANQAKMAFDQALAAAKAEIPPIRKNRRVHFDSRKAGAASTDYRHEDLAEIARTVDPILGKHGLNYRYRTTQPLPGAITVTCILAHRDGHSEENSMSSVPDESGNKNPMQKLGSTVTYLQRYTIKAALGLAASHDDDGRASGDATSDDTPRVTAGQIAVLQAKCDEVGCPYGKFLKWAQVSEFEEIPADTFDGCMAGLASFTKAG